MLAHVGHAVARVVQTAHGPGPAESPVFRVKVRLTALAKARRRVKAAVARRARLNNLDKLKSVVAAMTLQHRQCRQQLQPQQAARTTFSRM